MREPVRDSGRLEHMLMAIDSMRHVLVHDYYNIDAKTAWQTAQDNLPSLRVQIANILTSLR